MRDYGINMTHTELQVESVDLDGVYEMLQVTGVEYTKEELFEKLTTDGYLYKSKYTTYAPTQKAMDMGLFYTSVNSVGKPNFKVHYSPVCITGWGVRTLLERYGGGFS